MQATRCVYTRAQLNTVELWVVNQGDPRGSGASLTTYNSGLGCVFQS